MDDKKPSKSNKQLFLTIILLVLIAILVTSITYFYAFGMQKKKNQASTSKNSQGQKTTDSSQTALQKTDVAAINPIDAKNKISTPATMYKIEQGDTLFIIASKFNLDWQQIEQANGLQSADKILAGQNLIIPIFDSQTNTIKVDFKLDEEKTKKLQEAVKSGQKTGRTDPLITSQLDNAKAFGLTTDSVFSLKSKDEAKGTAFTIGSTDTKNIEVELYQPQDIGIGSIWAIKCIYQAK